MYTLRRHYRRLLLPPGWVMLGCQMVLIDRARLCPQRRLQLTMPCLEAQAKKRHQEGISYCIMFYMPLAYVKTRKNWHTVHFTGMPMNDFLSASLVETAVRTIQADTSHAGSVCVYLHQGTPYTSLVSLLDMMNKLNQKEYWLDVEHQPMLFYVTTRKRSPYAERQQEKKDFYL
jgi:hypothetical protein